MVAAECDLARFHNAERFRPTIVCTGSPGGWDHMGNNLTLAPQPSLTAPSKVGRRHNYNAPGGRDHIVFTGQATWRTSSDMYNHSPQEPDHLQGSSQQPWAAEQQNKPSAALALPSRQSSIRESSDHQRQSAIIDNGARQPSDLHMVPGAVDTQNAVPFEIVGRKSGEALHLLRAALAGRGIHGALEFAQQLWLASTATSSRGRMIGFTDIARVVGRFCTIADAYIHAIFRALDKDCYGCVSVSEILDIVLVRLTTQRMNQVKIVFAAIHEALIGNMDIHAVLQLEQFKNHADHLSGRKSKSMLIGEFADCISSDTVTWDKWQMYYRAISTSTMAHDASFSQSVKDTWRIQYPGDEAAAASRASAITEPTPALALKHGSPRHIPQALHVGASPIFNPTTYQTAPTKKQGIAACGRWAHSAVHLG